MCRSSEYGGIVVEIRVEVDQIASCGEEAHLRSVCTLSLKQHLFPLLYYFLEVRCAEVRRRSPESVTEACNVVEYEGFYNSFLVSRPVQAKESMTRQRFSNLENSRCGAKKRWCSNPATVSS